MKLIRLLAVAAFAASMPLTSCTGSGSKLPDFDQIFAPERKEKLAKLGNTVLVVGQLTGQINPKQAEAIQKFGALVLKQDGTADTLLVTASQEAVAAAIRKGKITEAQAADLYSVGVVPLDALPSPATGPSNPLLPPVSP